MDCTCGFHRIFSIEVVILVAIFSTVSFSNVVYPKDEEDAPHPSAFRGRVNGALPVGRRNLQPPSVRCSDNDTFCEEVQNYPMEQVKVSVSSNSSSLQFLRHTLESETSDSIFRRKRPTEVDYKEKRVCDVITRTVFPKAAKTSKNVWKYVVNTDTTYKQGIEIEQCSEENAPCNLCTAEKSRCVQKFIGRKMLVFDENELDSYIDLFNFPAACVCYVNDIF